LCYRDFVAAALTGQSEGFQTAAGIHHSLSELYRNLADNKTRRAAPPFPAASWDW
jgi:hypothetical protein